jgi:hypothetical protein
MEEKVELVKRFVARATLILAGLVGGLLVAEIALRIIGFHYDPVDNFSRPIYQRDPELGWWHIPGATSDYVGEGQSHVTINSLGLRDRDHLLAKPGRCLRIAVLGDSIAEAVGLQREKNFCSVLERSLATCERRNERQVEVINFGVGGYGTAQELLMLRHHIWDYAPDIVVLAFFPGNDITDNSSALTKLAWPEAPARPYFNLNNGSLMLDESFRASPEFGVPLESRRLPSDPVQAIKRRSRVLQLFARIKGIWPSLWVWPLERRPLAEFTGGLRPPEAQAYEQAWLVTEALVTEIYQDVHRHGAEFLLVVDSDPLQVYPDRDVRQKLQSKAGIRNPFYVNQRLAALAQREGFPVFSLGEPFLKYAEEHHALLHGFSNFRLGVGHWNAEGHRLAGQMIAAKVCAMLDKQDNANKRPEQSSLPRGTARPMTRPH